jgi:hypothetical protein
MQHNHTMGSGLDFVFQTTGEKVGGLVSAAMISSPLWLQEVKPYSDIAAIFAPILGCTYLLLQIGFKLWDRARGGE